MFEQVFAQVFGHDFEVVGDGPLRVARALIPAVHNFPDLQPATVSKEAPRRFVGLVTGIGFNNDRGQLRHTRSVS